MVTNRLNIPSGDPITNDFPDKSRTALSYVLSDLYKREYIQSEYIIQELNRVGRFTTKDIKETEEKTFVNEVAVRLHKLRWFDVMNFCERVYDKYLISEGQDWYESIDIVREYFSKEINQILLEDNLSFVFKDGCFERRGRLQTQKNIEKVTTVLSDPQLEFVKSHYNKAIKYFNLRPVIDAANCVKEALCALEAAIEILTSKKASNDFDKALNQLKGNESRHIPAPIAESIIKIHSYRGSGQGIAHAAISGNRVYQEEAELVLSLVAAYITYLYDVFPLDDIPF